ASVWAAVPPSAYLLDSSTTPCDAWTDDGQLRQRWAPDGDSLAWVVMTRPRSEKVAVVAVVGLRLGLLTQLGQVREESRELLDGDVLTALGAVLRQQLDDLFHADGLGLAGFHDLRPHVLGVVERTGGGRGGRGGRGGSGRGRRRGGSGRGRRRGGSGRGLVLGLVLGGAGGGFVGLDLRLRAATAARLLLSLRGGALQGVDRIVVAFVAGNGGQQVRQLVRVGRLDRQGVLHFSAPVDR